MTETILDTYIDVVRQNNEALNPNAFTFLGIYVYVLQDPSTKRIFYVGKGGSTVAGAGSNSRVLDHFDEAELWLMQPQPSGVMPDKVRTILNIWRRGEAVNWFVVRHALRDVTEAFHIESALIDALPLSCNGPLDNVQGGMHANAHGLLSPAGVAAHGAVLVNPQQAYPHVLVFPIQTALNANQTAYGAVRGYWLTSLATRNMRPCLAVGLVNGISRVVVEIINWTSAPAVPGKWEFSGNVVQNSDLLNKNFSNVQAPVMGYWMRGNYIGVEFDGKDQFRIFRGSQNKTDWYPCI